MTSIFKDIVPEQQPEKFTDHLQLTEGPVWHPDGMMVDTSRNLYVTGAGGVWVISPDAEHLGTIVFPELTANVGFGDYYYKTLFVTARTGLYSVRVNVTGIAPRG